MLVLCTSSISEGHDNLTINSPINNYSRKLTLSASILAIWKRRGSLLCPLLWLVTTGLWAFVISLNCVYYTNYNICVISCKHNKKVPHPPFLTNSEREWLSMSDSEIIEEDDSSGRVVSERVQVSCVWCVRSSVVCDWRVCVCVCVCVCVVWCGVRGRVVCDWYRGFWVCQVNLKVLMILWFGFFQYWIEHLQFCSIRKHPRYLYSCFCMHVHMYTVSILYAQFIGTVLVTWLLGFCLWCLSTVKYAHW